MMSAVLFSIVNEAEGKDVCATKKILTQAMLIAENNRMWERFFSQLEVIIKCWPVENKAELIQHCVDHPSLPDDYADKLGEIYIKISRLV